VESHVVTLVLDTNRRDDTIALLASLGRGTYGNHSLIVLDNASTDGSAAAIRSAFPAVDVLPLAENRGYAGNNNVGLRAALARGADWVFVLNEDVVVAPDCLARLVEAGERDGATGFVGPMVYHFDEPEVIQSAGGVLDRRWRAGHVGQNEEDGGRFVTRPVDWISGCAMLVRRAVLERVGLLDERFFIYWEETEWCLRARREGWRVVHVPAAKVWHKGVRRDHRPTPSVTYYSTRNRFLLLAKHRAPLAAWGTAWGQTLRTLASWTLRPKWRSMHEHRDAMWWGVVDFLRHHWGMRAA
jgi:GT2 family glycosyltransferase